MLVIFNGTIKSEPKRSDPIAATVCNKPTLQVPLLWFDADTWFCWTRFLPEDEPHLASKGAAIFAGVAGTAQWLSARHSQPGCTGIFVSVG